MDDKLNKTDKEGIDLLKYIFNNSLYLFNRIAPNGWINSKFVHFMHPTPEQQFVEHKRITDKINQLSKKEKKNMKNFYMFSDFLFMTFSLITMRLLHLTIKYMISDR
jgi:hypothetical protein